MFFTDPHQVQCCLLSVNVSQGIVGVTIDKGFHLPTFAFFSTVLFFVGTFVFPKGTFQYITANWSKVWRSNKSKILIGVSINKSKIILCLWLPWCIYPAIQHFEKYIIVMYLHYRCRLRFISTWFENHCVLSRLDPSIQLVHVRKYHKQISNK